MSVAPLFLLLLGVALALALVRRRLSAAGFLAADHQAGAVLTGLAGTAIGLSAFVFVGGPALFAQLGSGAFWLILSAPFTGVLQCWVVGGWILAHHPRPLTVPELLGQRFGPGVRVTAAVLVALGCLAALSVQARAVAVLAEGLGGGSGEVWALAVFLATAAYMAAGGMRAGVWADAVQGVIMGLVAVALAASALLHTREAVANLFAAGSPWLTVFGKVPPSQAVAWYLLFCLGTLAQPHYLQKFFLLRSREELRRFPWVLTVSLMAVLTVWVGVGLSALALVQQGELPAGAGDAVVPLLLKRLGPTAVLAAAVGCLAAIMSTVASFCNLLSACLVYDLPQALGRPGWSLAWSRVVTLAGGLLGTLLGVGSSRSVAFLGVLGWGFFTASLLPAVLAARFSLGSSRAVVTAMVLGAGVCAVLELFRPHLPIGLEPGLLGASLGLLWLVAFSREET